MTTQGHPGAAPRVLRRYDVLVLGAGYAGIMAALRLGRRRLGLRVALINQSDQFMERVRLQEAMVAPVTSRIRSLDRYFQGTATVFIRGRVLAFALNDRQVLVDRDGIEERFGFDEVVLALGSQVDVEQIPGAEQHAFRLDPGAGDCATGALRRALHSRAGDAARVVVVGGGALSLEIAGEVKSRWPSMDVKLISPGRAGSFQTPKVERVARRDLLALGLTLIDDQKTRKIDGHDVVTVHGARYPYDICIVAAGMRCPSVAEQAGVACDRTQRALVGPDLRSVSHPCLTAIGDCAHPIASTGAPYRASALAAAVSGLYCADRIIADRAGRASPPFAYTPFAQAIALGRFAALFPLDRNDRQALFVYGGRGAARIRSFLIWLVLYFIRFEHTFPGVQTWLGRKRTDALD